MSVVLELEPEVEELLNKQAQKHGSKLNEYAARLLKNHAVQNRTYEQVMTPLWEAFEKTGMTEDELNELIDREKNAVREEGKAKRG